VTTTADHLPDLADLEAAAEIVYRTMSPTPQYRWPLLEERAGGEVWVKHENHAPTGAFKIRGGLVYLQMLGDMTPRVEGIVTATRGNHGQSIAMAARSTGIPVLVLVPHNNAADKNAAMRALGAEVMEFGSDFQEAVEEAARIAVTRGWHRIPTFHERLVCGVATYTLELLRAVPELETVYVPIGQGSGICGAIAARNALSHKAEIIGVVSTGAPAYARSLAAGKLVSCPVTTELADGMACRTPNESALRIIANAGIRVVEVSDEQIADAIRLLFTATHNVAEGAGAAATAALLSDTNLKRKGPRAVVLSGQNIDSAVLARILSQG
jgi:threonine dehydratase